MNPTTVEEAIKICTPMVNKMAHKWKRNHYQMFNDLQQDGFMGVVEAWNRFNGSPEQKEGTKKFTTYAWWWIRACVRETAMKQWDYLNHIGSDDTEFFAEKNKYEMNERLMSFLRQIDKLPSKQRKMYELRMEGLTFAEIADEIGEKSLHKVRNQLLEINKQLEEA